MDYPAVEKDPKIEATLEELKDFFDNKYTYLYAIRNHKILEKMFDLIKFQRQYIYKLRQASYNRMLEDKVMGFGISYEERGKEKTIQQLKKQDFNSEEYYHNADK